VVTKKSRFLSEIRCAAAAAVSAGAWVPQRRGARAQEPVRGPWGAAVGAVSESADAVETSRKMRMWECQD